MVYPVILFPATATTFNTNGLGYLGEATSCVITEEGNGSFELEMVYPVTGRRFNDLVNRAIIFAKPNPVDPPQAFRIYEYSKPMNGMVTYYAEHISYDLNGYPVKPFTASNCAQALSSLKANAVISHNFSFSTDKATAGNFRLENPETTRSILGGVEGSILDTFHGEYKFDNFNITLYNNRGMDRGVTIRYGKNLLDIKQEENCANVYTDILPFWAGEADGVHEVVMLPEVTLPTKGTYNYRRVLVVDMSSEFQEKPFVVDLRAAANTYISNNDLGVPEVSMEVSFAQLEQTEEYSSYTLLERVELFDTVTVEFPAHNISATAKVTKTVYDAILGRYTSVTLGSIRSNMSDTVAKQGVDLNSVPGEIQKQTTVLEQAVQNATNWITNGKGYMVAIKNASGQWTEICSLDNPDITKALNVWRWNNGGFGHSSKGYNGPYTVAITQDGKIVADFITTGTLKGIKIITGNSNWRDSRVEIDPGSISFITHYSTDQEYCNISSNETMVWHGAGTYRSNAIATIFKSGKNVIELNANGTPALQIVPANSNAYTTSHEVSIDGCLAVYGVAYVTKDLQVNGKIYGEVVGDEILTYNYGKISASSYVTTTSMIGDIGEGVTDENGECYVYLNDTYSESIQNNCEYQVFLQKEGNGNIWVEEKNKYYFVVNGTENLKFAWEIKAKLANHEYDYLEKIETNSESKVDYELEYFNEINDLIINKEDYNDETA